LLIESPLYEKVIAITRQDLTPHSKLIQIKMEFGNITEKSGMLKADDVFCCLGTTMAKAGSKEKFRQVDFYYPYLLAKTTRAAGARQYLLVSTLGANKSSRFFTMSVKGEGGKAADSSVGFDGCDIFFRPSLLAWARTENRFGVKMHTHTHQLTFENYYNKTHTQGGGWGVWGSCTMLAEGVWGEGGEGGGWVL
jgi:hypothetical protein